ncbi:MAG: alpha/beta hydrolase [Methyloceanibacter sp.]
MLNLVLSLIGAYALICTGGWVLHRYFLYLPDTKRYAPREVGLSDVEEVILKSRDGVTLIAWHQPARGNKPTLLYFTGNSGSAANRARKIETIAASGYGVLMLNYRRYGGSGGWPSEENNVADAAVAYDYLREIGLGGDDIVAYGESLGTAVATRLALQRPVKALVLEAPFTSAVDVGNQVWWFLPLRLIMTDQYRTIDRIASVKVPLLIVHGARDDLIPVSHARQVYAAANEPKTLSILRMGGHNDLFDHGAWQKITDFLEIFEQVEVRPAAAIRVPRFEPVALAS